MNHSIFPISTSRSAYFLLVGFGFFLSAVPSLAAPIFSQTVADPTVYDGASASDLGDPGWAAFQVADDLTLTSTETARSATWWGTLNNPPVLPVSFDLIFYADSGGLPDPNNVINSTTVTFNSLTDTGLDITGKDIYVFRADLTPTVLPAGTKVWFSVLADTQNDPDDNFFWRNDNIEGQSYAQQTTRNGVTDPFQSYSNLSYSFILDDASLIAPPEAAVLVDLNADGTNRNATTADFEGAAGFRAGTLTGKTVHVFPNNNPGGGAFSQTVNNITIEVSDITNDADGWFGAGANNNLLDDGLYYQGTGTAPTALITLSGSGLGLAPNRQYGLYLFAGRSQGHQTTFTFAGSAVATDAPVVGSDNTRGTALFNFETTGTAPSSLEIQWDGLANVNGSQDAVFSGFALLDMGATNTYASWIGGFGLDAGDQDFEDDPDGDGLGNGVEAYFGTDPGNFDAGLTEVSKSGNTVGFQHPNPTTPLDNVAGSYRWSLDLVTWYDADGVDGDGSTTVNAVATPNSPTANATMVEATIGGIVPGTVFLRVLATTP